MSVEIHMIPLSNGDGTLLVDYDSVPPVRVLVDTGRHSSQTLDYLKQLGIARIDLIIVSHFDFDHIGGLKSLTDNLKVGEMWIFDVYRLRKSLEGVDTQTIPGENRRGIVMRFVTAADNIRNCLVKGVPCVEVLEGYQKTIGRFALEVLWPPRQYCDFILRPEVLGKFFGERGIPSDWIADDIMRRFEEEHEGQEPRRDEKQRMAREMARRLIEPEGQMKPDPDIPPEDEPIIEWPGEHFANNLSTVVKVTLLDDWHRSTMLFPGDLEDWGPLLLRQGGNLRANLFKVPHHASKHVGYDLRTQYECIWEEVAHKAPPPWRYVFREWYDIWIHYYPRIPFLPVWPFLPSFSEWTIPAGGGGFEDFLVGGLEDIARQISPAYSLIFPLVGRAKPLPNSFLEHSPTWGRILSNRSFEDPNQLVDKSTLVKATVIEIGTHGISVR